MTRTRSALVALFLCLFAGLANAADENWICVPNMTSTQALALLSAPPVALGSVSVQVETPAAEAEAWWCLEPALSPAGKRLYRPQYRWNLKENSGHSDLAGAFRRIAAAPDLLAGVNGERRAASIAVTPGSQKAYERALVLRAACLALAKPPYLVPIDPLPANWCGADPVPPGQVADVWRTPASGTFTIYTVAGGKLAAVVPGKKAAANATCNCTIKVVSGSSTYCPIAAAPPTEFTLCRKATP